MRTLLLIVLLALPPLFEDGADDGARKGREGNARYGEERYEDAATAYLDGLTAAGTAADAKAVRYGLQNNLGAALLKAGDAEAAGQAFRDAMALASTEADFARSAYNGGNAAYARDDLQAALDHYRRALLADPSSEDAKYNFEFVKRRLDQQQQQQQQQQQNQQQDGEGENEGEQQQQNESGESGDQEQQRQNQGGDQGEQEPPRGDRPQEDRQPGESPPEEQQQGQDGSQPQDPREGGDRPAGGQPPPQAGELSQEQAQHILEALQNEEEQLLRQLQRAPQRGAPTGKDW